MGPGKTELGQHHNIQSEYCPHMYPLYPTRWKKKMTTSSSEEYDGEESVIAEMHAALDDLYRHHQTIEDNVLQIQQHWQDTNTVYELEVLDP